MARRDYGSGGLMDKGNGRWLLRWYEPPDPITGARRRRAETFVGTKKDAARELAARATSSVTTRPPVTLRVVIEQWRAQAGHELGTARNYDLAVRTLSGHFLGLAIGDIRAAHLNELYRRVEADHGVHRTRMVHALISGALTYAWRMEWILSNPARRVQPPAQPRRKPTEPTDVEVARLLELVQHDPQYLAWLLVATSTGCRRGEVLALRWSHVRLDVGEIVVEQALDPVDGHEKDTKTHGTRVIAVGPTVIEALKRWRTAMAARALASVGTLVADPFVFSDSLDGARPWRPDVATKRFGRLRDQAGLVGVRQHDLRHYVATTLLAANIDAKSVAGRMGHTRVATTNDLYARALPARDRAAADVLERRLGG